MKESVTLCGTPVWFPREIPTGTRIGIRFVTFRVKKGVGFEKETGLLGATACLERSCKRCAVISQIGVESEGLEGLQ